MWGISRICETPYVFSGHQSSSIHTTNSRCVLYIKAHDTLTGFRYQFLAPANWYQKPVMYHVPIFTGTGSRQQIERVRINHAPAAPASV